jgi:hypothetical protein
LFGVVAYGFFVEAVVIVADGDVDAFEIVFFVECDVCQYVGIYV